MNSCRLCSATRKALCLLLPQRQYTSFNRCLIVGGLAEQRVLLAWQAAVPHGPWRCCCSGREVLDERKASGAAGYCISGAAGPHTLVQ